MKLYDLKQIFRFFHRFLHHYYITILFLVMLNMLPGFLLGIRPLVLAPALGKVFSNETPAANSWSEITLDNMGATLMAWTGGQSDDLASTFFWSALLYMIMTICVAVTSAAANLWSIATRLKILEDMINALHQHLMRLPLQFFLRHKTGDLVSRFSTDLTTTASSMEAVVRGCIQSAAQAAIYLVILFRSDSLLSLQVLLIGSLHLLVTRVLGNWVKRRTSVAYDGLAGLTAALQESFQGVRVVKSFAAEAYDSQRVANEAEQVKRNVFRFRVARYTEDPIRLLTDGVVSVLIIYLSYSAIINNRLTMAGIALFFYLASQLVLPIAEFSRNWLTAYSIQGGFAKLLEMFETENELPDGPNEHVVFDRDLVLQDVTFEYLPGQPVLEEINLTIQQGETLAIVGPSGAGKSTLTDLILRLYDPVQGRILLDGEDLRSFKQNPYRSLFGVVSQECLLFNTSIRDNITLGRPLEEPRLHQACRMANIDEFIASLPEGFDTFVGDRGVRLSGGQRQRMAIARAVYGAPKILVLDEATSALDTESEREVQKAIEQVLEGVTGIVIAHRLSTVVNADRIIVVVDGRIEAMGIHKELMKISSTYKRLCSLQFGAVTSA